MCGLRSLSLFPSFLSFSICFCRSVSVLVRLSVSLSLSLCNFVCRYRKFLSLSHRASHIVVLFIFGITIWSLVKTVWLILCRCFWVPLPMAISFWASNCMHLYLAKCITASTFLICDFYLTSCHCLSLSLPRPMCLIQLIVWDCQSAEAHLPIKVGRRQVADFNLTKRSLFKPFLQYNPHFTATWFHIMYQIMHHMFHIM